MFRQHKSCNYTDSGVNFLLQEINENKFVIKHLLVCYEQHLTTLLLMSYLFQ